MCVGVEFIEPILFGICWYSLICRSLSFLQIGNLESLFNQRSSVPFHTSFLPGIFVLVHSVVWCSCLGCIPSPFCSSGSMIPSDVFKFTDSSVCDSQIAVLFSFQSVFSLRISKTAVLKSVKSWWMKIYFVPLSGPWYLFLCLVIFNWKLSVWKKTAFVLIFEGLNSEQDFCEAAQCISRCFCTFWETCLPWTCAHDFALNAQVLLKVFIHFTVSCLILLRATALLFVSLPIFSCLWVPIGTVSSQLSQHNPLCLPPLSSALTLISKFCSHFFQHHQVDQAEVQLSAVRQDVTSQPSSSLILLSQGKKLEMHGIPCSRRWD